MYFGFYTVFLKEVKCGDLRYGKNTYDYQEGTLVFIAPGQIVRVDSSGEFYQPNGHALVFHPDLVHGTSLGRNIKDYTFSAINQMKLFMYPSEKEKWFWSVFQKLSMS